MSLDTANIIFFSAVIVFGFVWLIGVRFALARVRPARRREEERAFSRSASRDPEAIEGEVLLDGEPEDLARRLASHLVAGGAGSAGLPVKIAECTAERVAFERVSGGGRRGLVVFDGGVVTLHGEGEKVRARYELNVRRSLGVLRLLAYLVCFLYGGLFVLGCPIIIWMFVLPHENPAVRMQVIQTFQMVHGVWPPFLIGSIASRVRKMTVAHFETLLANLRYIGPS